jgi:small subunit ribosomal protein S20|tara:strand:+ start:622 stop:876 length:255 start_codon:yes stop_codon:yes gene_type:complete
MANHKSALKRVRSDQKKRDRNHYQHKTTRNALRKLRASTDLKEATEMLPKVSSMLDKLSKNNVIHKNKAANLKASIAAHTSALK